jgi:hypothetical protein
MILKCVLNTVLVCILDSTCSEWDPVASSCEHNESQGSMTGKKLLDQINDNKLLKKEFSLWNSRVNYNALILNN